jgi:hypothetical protein
LMVIIKEAPKMIKHKNIGIMSLTPIDVILFCISHPDYHTAISENLQAEKGVELIF